MNGRLLAVLLLGLTAAGPPQSSLFASEYGDQHWGPNGNGTLDHEDDLRWVEFHDAHVTADNAKGIYIASFSAILQKMDGRPFSITGYMLPIEHSIHSAHFVLTRRSAGCPFCPPNEPTEAMEVFASKPVDYTQAPVTAEGILHLVRHSAQGLFFKLDQARVG